MLLNWMVESVCTDGFLRCSEEGSDLKTTLYIAAVDFLNKAGEEYLFHISFLK